MQFGFVITPDSLARLLVLIAVAGMTTVSFAATAQISAAAVECEQPDPISLVLDPRVATPIGDNDATPLASLERTTTASPRQLLAAGLENLVKTFAKCRSEGDFETGVQHPR